MAGSMEGEVKITPRNSRGWRAVTETLTSIRADNARLRAALKAERMVRNARATPDPGDALIGRFVALIEERDTLRDALREAPEPDAYTQGGEAYHALLRWYNGKRQAALGLAEEKITPEPDRDLDEGEGNAWDDEPGWY